MGPRDQDAGCGVVEIRLREQDDDKNDVQTHDREARERTEWTYDTSAQ